MEQETTKVYPCSPLLTPDQDLEQRPEKKVNDAISFNNSTNNIKEINTYFKDKNHKSRKKCKKCEMLTTILKSIDTNVNISSSSCSIVISNPEIGLLIVPISTGIACKLTISNEEIYEIIMQKYNK